MAQNENITKENWFERTVSVLQTVTDDNLAETYAHYANQLRVEADCGIDEEEYAFLVEITDILKGLIFQRYMQEHGWYENDLDNWNRWEHE